MSRPSARERLLDAAATVVRRDGAQALTLDAVAAEAGVSKGGLLYHFRSKRDLLDALVGRWLDGWQADMDADAVGLSILSGAHMTLVPRVIELLREQDAGDVVVTVGGTIPAQDIPELKELGVAEVFTPGAPTQAIIDFIRSAVASR